MARFTSVSVSGAEPAATRTLATPASGTSSSQSQVHATVMSGSAPVESASASAACATSKSAARRAPERSRSASAAIASATSVAAAKSTTAVGRSGSRPPMSASMRMNRYPAGATQTIAGSKATVAWGPPAVTARAATRATTGSRTRTNAGSAKVSEGTPEKPLVPTD